MLLYSNSSLHLYLPFDKGSLHDYLQNYNNHLTIAGLMTTLPRRKERNDTFRTAASLIKRWVRDGVTLSHWRLRPFLFVLPDQRNFKINDFVIFKFILNKKNCYEELNFKRMSAISDLKMTMIQIEKELCRLWRPRPNRLHIWTNHLP